MKEFNVGNLIYVVDAEGNGMRLLITSKKADTAAYGCCRARGEVTYNAINTKNNTVITDIPANIAQETCDTAFKIGDEVQSKLGGGFVGFVTGFEPDSNRVVCWSSKGDGGPKDRVRYAYKVDEIELTPNIFEFRLNRKYRDQNGVVYRTIEVPKNVNKFILINDASGTVVDYVDIETPKCQLCVKGIIKLEDLSVRKYRG